MHEFKYSLLDQHFSRFMVERSGLSSKLREQFKSIVQDLSAALADGHSCLRINPEDTGLLLESPLVSTDSRTPFVIFEQYLYLNRYYQYEFQLAVKVREMSCQIFPAENYQQALDRLFGEEGVQGPDLQQLSACVALERSFSIISGGPGTGKTSTVVKIIALLLDVYGEDMKVALAAPTGKAAMRLRQSIEENRKKHLPADMSVHVPSEVMTLHRLLGVKNFSPSFRHNRDNPLEYDIVIVDEASMVDLALMSKLAEALKPGTRLVLLGDKDQLASVESGSVLSDLIAALPENTTILQKSYRFDHVISEFSRLINKGNSSEAWMLLNAAESENVSLTSLSAIDSVGQRYETYMAKAVSYNRDLDYGSLFDSFNKFQILCALRNGDRGVEEMNRKVEKYLVSRGYESPSGEFYQGRPVMVTRNDYSLDLYNGDIGICLADREGQLKVYFQQPDGSIMGVLPNRLPLCETVFAMTIHKSQGSEFNNILVVLPDCANRVLSRELVYTAVTRARKRVEIMVEQEVFELSIQRRVERYSGLKKMLMRPDLNENKRKLEDGLK